MIFKNARILRFIRPAHIEPERLDELLQNDAFQPCGPQEMSRTGWVSPMGKLSEQLVHAANGFQLICLQRQDKLLPSSVVNDYVAERVDAIEHEQSRTVRRKERNEIKEQVILEMLPQAFCRNRKTYGYLDTKNQFLVIDTGSASVAEDFASTLRKTLGSLPVRPIAMEQSPAFTFTGWLSGAIEQPDIVALGEDCWMADPSQDGGKIIARGLDLASDEVRNHLEAGMQATKLTMTWDENVSFCLDENLAVTRIKFAETVLERLDETDSDDAAAVFDSEFCLMTLELSRLIPGLLRALGGEDRSALIEDCPIALGEAPDELRTSLAEDSEIVHEDSLYPEAVQLVVESRRASISRIQRAFKIGYNRAANIVDCMEARGVVSAANHNGIREVLI
jgi:recombination associated protein RdgC